MKYFLYVRKSSEDKEKQVLSLGSQAKRAREMFPNLDIIELPHESGSAFTPNNRPVFTDMIRRIEKGEAQGIIAWHPDRLSRNEIEAATITYHLRRGVISDLKFCSYTYENSEEGIMMLQMVMSHSQYFSAKLSKDTRRGLADKVNDGWLPGNARIGYLNTPGKKKGTREVISDPERFDLVESLWRMMLTGEYTVAELHKIADEKLGLRLRKTPKTGGTPLSRSGMYGMFTSIFYAGKILFKGEVFEGKQKPMVTLAEYDRVQQLLGRKGKPRPKKHQFAYRGHITCADCGCAITAEPKLKFIKSEKITREYIYYHCTWKKPCGQRKSVTEPLLEEQIDEYLKQITIAPEFQKWALQVLQELNIKEIKVRSKVHKSQSKALFAAQRELDQLTKMRMKELINDAEYTLQRNDLTEVITRLEEEVQGSSERAKKWLTLTEDAFDFATNARKRFANGDLELKRSIMLTLGQNFQLTDRKLIFEPNPWLVPIQKEYPAIKAEFDKVRTNKRASTQEREAAFACVYNYWLRRLDCG